MALSFPFTRGFGDIGPPGSTPSTSRAWLYFVVPDPVPAGTVAAGCICSAPGWCHGWSHRSETSKAGGQVGKVCGTLFGLAVERFREIGPVTVRFSSL